MSSGDEHTRLAIASIGSIVAGAVAALFVPLRFVLIGAVACMVGELLLSPDLDHPAGCRAFRRWWILRAIWIPYQSLVWHRSPWSHWPIIGTAGRLAYLGVPLYGAACLVGGPEAVPELHRWATTHWREIVAAVAGVELSAVLHLLGDL